MAMQNHVIAIIVVAFVVIGLLFAICFCRSVASPRVEDLEMRSPTPSMTKPVPRPSRSSVDPDRGLPHGRDSDQVTRAAQTDVEQRIYGRSTA